MSREFDDAELEQRPNPERGYVLPSIDLLDPTAPSSGGMVDKAALERNARLLEAVLDDFKVPGEIVEVRPGPVVTVYMVETAPGTMSSQVSVLAADIARNMASVTARVVAIPGSNVIGIELPNVTRQPVGLRDLVESQSFEDQRGQLPIILGKDVIGQPAIVDLASMTHLLLAGTTGSGKSVGLNGIILSLLYRLTPDRCRFIMIDLKVLELSTYGDIPHLLSPVVTDVAKAVRALSWTVRQMEDRYRQMSSLGVRSFSGVNDKVRQAKAKGQPFGRKVQAGFHPDTGQPVYEQETLEYEVLPRIVVIVDELGELLGSHDDRAELRQALHQIAERGAVGGIHMILASSRWDAEHLDDLVGVTAACRLAYPMAEGDEAEAFLGIVPPLRVSSIGDVLYLSQRNVAARLHGANVSDLEAQHVADHWRTQGQPDYISSITVECDEGCSPEGSLIGEETAELQQYRKAVQLVCESQKASTSWLQRQLRISYNAAARLIVQMEEDGIVGRPDHLGRRDMLRDQDGRVDEIQTRDEPRGWLSRMLN